MKSTKISIIVYIDHDVALNIAQQISLIISLTNKLNPRLIRVLDKIQRFYFQIRHKFDRFNIVFDALLRLSSSEPQSSDNVNDEELNVLHTTSSIEMNAKFKEKIFQEYKENFDCKKIDNIMNTDSHTVLFFAREDERIYQKETNTDITSFLSRRICVLL